jgi:hypothetical protein
MTWVQGYLDRVAAHGPGRDKPQLRDAAIAMFDDAVFQKAFGKPLREMSLDESPRWCTRCWAAPCRPSNRRWRAKPCNGRRRRCWTTPS